MLCSKCFHLWSDFPGCFLYVYLKSRRGALRVLASLDLPGRWAFLEALVVFFFITEVSFQKVYRLRCEVDEGRGGMEKHPTGLAFENDRR